MPRLLPLPLVALALVIARGAGCASPEPIVSEPFEPTAVKIELGKLPLPNEASSVRKVAKLVPAPTPAVLRVPRGFTVTNYYDGELAKPRWLALTPDGDLLVTET